MRGLARVILGTVLRCAAAGIPWCGGAIGAEDVARLTNAKIMRNFNIVAFGNEYTLKRCDHVRKWGGPIRVGIQGKNYPPYFEDYVKQQIRDLWELTGHPIELYYSFSKQKAKTLAKDFDPKKVNFINDEAAVRKMIRVSTCFAKFFTRNNEITAAIAVFPSHHPKTYMRACVVEELTWVLGLANDSSQVNPSIFNDTSRHFELTEHDKWMLRMFYDPRITPGTP